MPFDYKLTLRLEKNNKEIYESSTEFTRELVKDAYSRTVKEMLTDFIKSSIKDCLKKLGIK